MNKYKGEVSFPVIGDGMFLRFTLDDLAVLEAEFGANFFDEVEKGCANFSPTIIRKCLAVGVKEKTNGESLHNIWTGINQEELQESGFLLSQAVKPILEALSQSWLGKSYDELVVEAQKAREKQEREQVERAKAAVLEAKEVADSANLPFDPEASLNALLELLTRPGLIPSESGDSHQSKSGE